VNSPFIDNAIRHKLIHPAASNFLRLGAGQADAGSSYIQVLLLFDCGIETLGEFALGPKPVIRGVAFSPTPFQIDVIGTHSDLFLGRMGTLGCTSLDIIFEIVDFF